MIKLSAAFAALSCAALALSGCGVAAPRIAPAPTAATASPSPSASASAPPSVITVARAQSLLATASVPTGAFASIEGKRGDKDLSPVIEPRGACGTTLPAQSILAGLRREWLIADVATVRQAVAVHKLGVAAAVVDHARSDFHACPKSRTHDDQTEDRLSVFTLPSIPGTSRVFGYCERLTFAHPKSTNYYCAMYLADRGGHVLSMMSAAADTLTDTRDAATVAVLAGAKQLAKLPAVY